MKDFVVIHWDENVPVRFDPVHDIPITFPDMPELVVPNKKHSKKPKVHKIHPTMQNILDICGHADALTMMSMVNVNATFFVDQVPSSCVEKLHLKLNGVIPDHISLVIREAVPDTNTLSVVYDEDDRIILKQDLCLDTDSHYVQWARALCWYFVEHNAIDSTFLETCKHTIKMCTEWDAVMQREMNWEDVGCLQSVIAFLNWHIVANCSVTDMFPKITTRKHRTNLFIKQMDNIVKHTFDSL